MTFFTRFNRIIGRTYGVVFLCALALFVLLFYENLDSRKKTLQLRLAEQTQSLDYLLRIRHDAVNGMRLQAEDFFKNSISQNYYPMISLKNNSQKTYFHMDVPFQRHFLVGNITGLGNLETLKSSVWDEIFMAYTLNPLFKVIKENIKTATYLKYISKNHFQNLYPWHSSFEKRFDKRLYEKDYFRRCLPEYNPQREILWSDPYYDPTSDRMLQPCSAPVYRDNQFQGVVALDFNLSAVDYFIDSIHYPQGHLMVVNNHHSVISNTDHEPGMMFIQRVDRALPKELLYHDILQQEEYVISTKGPYCVFWARTYFAPWTLVYYIDTRILATNSLMHVGPSVFFVLVFSMLILLLTNKLIRNEFIEPAGRLVTHITNQGHDSQEGVQLQEPWKSWFDAISNVFQQNRSLVAKLESHIRTLDANVQSRTLELSLKNQDLEKAMNNLQKIQKQIIVQEKLAVLGSITAGIAHEIKNPLHFIVNFSHISQEFTEDIKKILKPYWPSMKAEEQEEIQHILMSLCDNLQRICDHSKRADGIVRSMLTHAKGGKDTKQQTNLQELLKENLLLVLTSCKTKGKTVPKIIENYQSKSHDLWVYQQSLGRVFLNILQNACDALHERQSEEGPDFRPIIKIATFDTPSEITIIIEDNGPGVPKKLQKSIFEAFFTTKPVGSGTGLGLSLCYDIVTQQHHGQLSLVSEEGLFTRFSIILPKENHA